MKDLFVFVVVGLVAVQVAAIRWTRRQQSLETYALIRESVREVPW